MSGLSFDTLRAANKYRGEQAKQYNSCVEWTHAQWMMALVGEVGELANYLKKVDRGDFTLDEKFLDIAKELADIQIYLDLLALKLNVDLGKATVAKYNEVSRRIGSNVFLSLDDTWRVEE